MELDSLLQLPESSRDENWERQFLDAILAAKVEPVGDQAQAGPDGWPYFLVRTVPNAQEPFRRIVEWAAARGIGLALNTHKMVPDYIFTYGMLWYFTTTGRFITPEPPAKAGEVNFSEGMIAGAPTEAYLPTSVRGVLREFLKAQGFAEPKIVVMTSQDFKTTDLVFSTESLNDLPAKSHRTMAEALAWFLPLHYSLVLGSERNLRGWAKL